MDYDELTALRRHDPAWRLLRAGHAPLVLAFLGRVFVDESARSVAAAELTARFEDMLYVLREQLGEDAFPKKPTAYLDDWAAPEQGWLRKFYPQGSNEPHYEATAALEKAVGWVASLRARAFVGTESRLGIVIELLRQMAFGTETDQVARLQELQRRRDEIDREIARVQAGELDIMPDSAVRDRYQQFAQTAYGILSDFREVEANFRRLDRAVRERISTWDGGKGDLLRSVLGDRDAIADSDEGRSFHAFYDFLLSPGRQEEFDALLQSVQSLAAVENPDARLAHIQYDWLEAAGRAQATVRLLSEQLRRFLDDQVWLENRRVMDILRNIEVQALRLRELPGADRLHMEMDQAAPEITLPLERPMYRPKAALVIDSAAPDSAEDDIDADVLFDQVYVDHQRLIQAVRACMGDGAQVGLGTVLDAYPLEQGLAELISYMALSDTAFEVVCDASAEQLVSWQASASDDMVRTARLPRVTFVRRRSASAVSVTQVPERNAE
ncbi:DUF3375 domain-containing protein [Uniformispora flossi]|uniref:DUF3375 domain-containing protein n=1 Tax=Uniformispora flossi TaxID=3390723 RepID=UPI003C309DA5